MQENGKSYTNRKAKVRPFPSFYTALVMRLHEGVSHRAT